MRDTRITVFMSNHDTREMTHFQIWANTSVDGHAERVGVGWGGFGIVQAQYYSNYLLAKKGRAESAFHDSCRTSSGSTWFVSLLWGGEGGRVEEDL